MRVAPRLLATDSLLTHEQDDGDYQAGATEDHGDSDNEDERQERVAQVRELASYLWQNYIE